MRHLLATVGNPERSFPSIHIAGTNGKGSTAAFLASIFMESKYITALYTSPHLVRFTERIKINGIEIDEKRIVQYTEVIRPAVESVQATFFEATTCMAFMYFADEGVDIAILEAGLGGRLDSTNVVHPLVSIITNVSYDHTEYLGATLGAIASEKAGIIKQNVPCITGAHQSDVLDTIRRIAVAKRSPVYQNDELASLRNAKEANGSFKISVTTKHLHLFDVLVALPGIHQIQNALTAVAASELVLRSRKTAFSRLNSMRVGRGLERVRKNTGLHGRFETLRRGKRYIFDVAHNPDGIKKLVSTLARQSQKNYIVVVGVMADKDYDEMLAHLAEFSPLIIPVRPRTKRALSVAKLSQAARRAGLRVRTGGSVQRGLFLAARHAKMGGMIVVTGSHYVVGEAIEYLK